MVSDGAATRDRPQRCRRAIGRHRGALYELARVIQWIDKDRQLIERQENCVVTRAPCCCAQVCAQGLLWAEEEPLALSWTLPTVLADYVESRP